MPKTVRKKSPTKSVKKKTKLAKTKQSFVSRIKNGLNIFKNAIGTYLIRRPHRSFRRTRRRDYVRSLEIPGYLGFTREVWRVITKNKRLFISLTAFYGISGAALVGLSSQDTYSEISGLLDQTTGTFFSNGWGSIEQAGLLVVSGLSGSFNPDLSDVQQIYSILLLLLTWLTTIWLLRTILTGKRPRLRDGLYSAGSPIVATVIVLLIMVMQLVPAALGVLVMNAAIGSKLFASGLVAMVITAAAALAIVLSLYWITSTILALVVVTLPGMYPWQAIKSAGDLVVGRRLRILKRLMWLMLTILLPWTVIVFVAIYIDRLVKHAISGITWIPFVPIVIAAVTAFSVVWSATYVYLLYRRVVQDDASPA